MLGDLLLITIERTQSIFLSEVEWFFLHLAMIDFRDTNRRDLRYALHKFKN